MNTEHKVIKEIKMIKKSLKEFVLSQKKIIYIDLIISILSKNTFLF